MEGPADNGDLLAIGYKYNSEKILCFAYFNKKYWCNRAIMLLQSLLGWSKWEHNEQMCSEAKNNQQVFFAFKYCW